MDTTAELSISHKTLDCTQVARLLQKNGIQCSIKSNVTMICPKKMGACHIENGCNIVYGLGDKKDVRKNVSSMWNLLKNKYDLTCAHLKIHGHFSGCIYDYLRPSLCPNKN